MIPPYDVCVHRYYYLCTDASSSLGVISQCRIGENRKKTTNERRHDKLITKPAFNGRQCGPFGDKVSLQIASGPRALHPHLTNILHAIVASDVWGFI